MKEVREVEIKLLSHFYGDIMRGYLERPVSLADVEDFRIEKIDDNREYVYFRTEKLGMVEIFNHQDRIVKQFTPINLLS